MGYHILISDLIKNKAEHVKLVFLLTLLFALIITAVAYSGNKNYHDGAMPDPHSFNAHFGDMDANGDDFVNWEEFAGHFENAEKKCYRCN